MYFIGIKHTWIPTDLVCCESSYMCKLYITPYFLKTYIIPHSKYNYCTSFLIRSNGTYITLNRC